jgi:hypothetical protein
MSAMDRQTTHHRRSEAYETPLTTVPTRLRGRADPNEGKLDEVRT